MGIPDRTKTSRVEHQLSPNRVDPLRYRDACEASVLVGENTYSGNVVVVFLGRHRTFDSSVLEATRL